MPIRPPLFSELIGPSTSEQRATALAETREIVTQLRDLTRELELPAQHLDLVKEIYTANLAGLMIKADQRKQKERRKKAKERALEMQRNGQGISQFGLPNAGMVPPISPLDYMFDDDDDED